eukprot:jgi/Hompol1/2748/HPOL_000637-RA
MFLYVVGLVLLLVMPLPLRELHHHADTDEKALLVGQVSRYYGHSDQDFEFFSPLGLAHNLWLSNATTFNQASLLASEMDAMGFDVSVQSFSYAAEDADEPIVGHNVHGIMRSPRGDGTEAILLSAPMFLDDGSQFSFWSKDIIFLVTTHGPYGSHAWLRAYYGFRPESKKILDYQQLDSHAGQIQSAINLEFAGSGEYSAVGIYPQGINGLLPNADLLVTTILSIQYEGMNLELHSGSSLKSDDSMYSRYWQFLDHLVQFVRIQASSLPSAGHALFLRYKIESVTLRGLSDPDKQPYIGMVLVSRGIETALRSLNNMLEKFHHAYWFYFMPNADHLMPISVYIAPLAVLASSLVLTSLGIWWDSTAQSIRQSGIAIDQTGDSVYVRCIAGTNSFTSIVRPLYLPAVTLGTCFAACAWVLSISETLTFIAAKNVESMFFVATVVIGLQILLSHSILPLIHRLAGGSGAATKSSEPAWRMLKLLCCGALGMVLITLTAINPSLAILIAIPNVPVFLNLAPGSSTAHRLFQLALLSILSPPGLLLIAAVISREPQRVMLAAKNAVHHWIVFDSQLVPVVCLLIWPLNLAAQTLIEMEQ